MALTRRRLIGGAAMLGAAALLPNGTSAQSATQHGAIDVHHHFYPPPLKDAANAWQAKHNLPKIGGRVGNWTPDATLADMDAGGTQTAILSLSSPHGVWFDVARERIPELSRSCNDYAAAMMKAQPGRFGLFACLPMPDVDASLKEIAYAFDVLHADGIGMPTSFGNVWPGDPTLAPVFAELNRRKAMVVFHPYAPNCCGQETLDDGIAESVLEYPYDTVRCVLSLLFNGTLLANRDVRFTFCHGGGPLPSLVGRIAVLAPAQTKTYKEVTPNGLDYEFRRLYYDTANAVWGPTMAALTKEIPMSQLMFGTDYPYLTTKQNVAGLMALGMSTADIAAIQRGNAERLLPRWKST